MSMLEHELKDDFIYDNVTLYITTIPGGAGGSFLGFLQLFYLDKVDYIEEKDFPYLNLWDGARDKHNKHNISGHNVYNIFSNSEGYRANPRNTTNLSKETLFSADQLSHKFIQGLPYACSHTARDIKLNGPFPVTKEGNYGILWHSHEFPFGVQQEFKWIRHLLSVIPNDFDTQLYIWQLKNIKTGLYGAGKSAVKISSLAREFTEAFKGGNLPRPWRNMKPAAKKVYEHQIKSNSVYPPATLINYNELFFNINKDVIKEFFMATMDIKEFNNDKLEPMCKMIETYTSLNNQLIIDFKMARERS